MKSRPYDRSLRKFRVRAKQGTDDADADDADDANADDDDDDAANGFGSASELSTLVPLWESFPSSPRFSFLLTVFVLPLPLPFFFSFNLRFLILFSCVQMPLGPLKSGTGSWIIR